MLGYDLGENHPMHPLRWELTWLLAETLGVLEGFDVLTPEPADVDTLALVHTMGYIDAVRRASRPGFPFSVGHGLGTADTPIFAGMHQNAALIAGGSVTAALAIAHGEVDRAVNFCGGLHDAMADSASGFWCTATRRWASPRCYGPGCAGSPTWTSTRITATACRPRSTPTPGY